MEEDVDIVKEGEENDTKTKPCEMCKHCHPETKCTYGKPAPGATFSYEFCCCFPQNPHTLHALENSIFIGI